MRARSFRVIFRVFFGRDPAADAPHFLGPRETLTSRRWRFVVSQSVETTNPRSLRNRATGIWVVGYFSRASRKNRKNFSTFVSSSRKIYKHGTNIYIYMHELFVPFTRLIRDGVIFGRRKEQKWLFIHGTAWTRYQRR